MRKGWRAMEKKQLTVRLPVPVVDYLADRAQSENKTLNELVTEVAEQYMIAHQSEQLIREIAVVRERAKNAYGAGQDSTDEIRRLREGER